MKTEKMKRYFVYTSIILHLYFLNFVEMKYTSSILSSLKRNILFRSSTSSMFLGFKINTSVLKVCFKYTSGFEDKYVSLESLLQTYL